MCEIREAVKENDAYRITINIRLFTVCFWDLTWSLHEDESLFTLCLLQFNGLLLPSPKNIEKKYNQNLAKLKKFQ